MKKTDKANKILNKNTTTKLLSKTALKRKVQQKQNSHMMSPEEQKFTSLVSVIEENISETNMLNSYDDQMNKSLQKGD